MDKELTPLEALNVIYNLEDLQGGRDEFWKAFRVIEEALKEREVLKFLLTGYTLIMEGLRGEKVEITPLDLVKKIKALETIKEKGNFLCLEYDEYNDKYYIYDNELYQHNEITKEEYDILKEVLDYEEEN